MHGFLTAGMKKPEISFSHALLFGAVPANSGNLLLASLRHANQADGTELNFRLRGRKLCSTYGTPVKPRGCAKFPAAWPETLLRHVDLRNPRFACTTIFFHTRKFEKILFYF